MSGSVNKVCLLGNVGKDPEIRRTSSGDPIVNLSIATSESWRDKNSGERREKTEWHKVVIFNEGLAKVAEQYVKKGSKLYIEGQLQTRKWTDQGGAERYTTEIVLQKYRGELVLLGDGKGEARDSSSVGNSYEQAKGGARPSAAARGGGGLREELDDEIPFGPEWR